MVAALPAFAILRDWVVSMEGGPVVSLAVATAVIASVTGSASGGLMISLDTFGDTATRLATDLRIDPELLHRVAAISSGVLDSLPHNGSVITILAVCRLTHRESYRDVAMVLMVGPLLALVVVIGLGTALGSF